MGSEVGHGRDQRMDIAGIGENGHTVGGLRGWKLAGSREDGHGNAWTLYSFPFLQVPSLT